MTALEIYALLGNYSIGYNHQGYNNEIEENEIWSRWRRERKKAILMSFERPKWPIRLNKRYTKESRYPMCKILNLDKHGPLQDREISEVSEAPLLPGDNGLYLLMARMTRLWSRPHLCSSWLTCSMRSNVAKESHVCFMSLSCCGCAIVLLSIVGLHIDSSHDGTIGRHILS